MDSVEFYQDETQGWRWRVKSPNGRIVGASTEGYAHRTSAATNLRSLMKYCRDVDIKIASETETRSADARHPLYFYEDVDKKWRWRVQVPNGQIVHASTESFSRRIDAKHDLEVLLELVRAWASS